MPAQLPSALQRLINAQLWKSDPRHYVDARVPRSVARRWNPSANGICLFDPQPLTAFVGVPFFREYGALDQLDVDRCFSIADFGIAADSPIIIDVGQPDVPVRYLPWNGGGEKTRSSTWREISSLDNFLEDIFPDGPGRPPFSDARSLEVNGDRFYWRPTHGEHLTLLVQQVGGQQQLEATWERPDGTTLNLDVTTEALVAYALAHGWTPRRSAPALGFSDMDAVIPIETMR